MVQSLPSAPFLNEENLETVLSGVRPFLAVAGGNILVVSLKGVGGMRPSIKLKMTGTGSALQSVKMEIMQRIARHFMMAVNIEWE